MWNSINAAIAVAMLGFTFGLVSETALSASGSTREGILMPAAAGAKVPRQQQPPAPPAQTTAATGDYVGEATCLSCHDDRAYTGTAHALAFNERTPAANHGCESCHGPGKAHAESGDTSLIRHFTNEPASAVSEVCLNCHNGLTHALWEGSQHDQRNVGCATCHSIHAAKGEPLLKAASQMELCSNCHRPITSKQHRFNHMPVREGGLTCSSCHNVHGSTNVKLLRVGTTVDESCTSCHTEKRGPYLWEHAPVSESCVTCHDPHGSNNDRLLVAKLPFLCQRCHVTSRHPPTVYEGYLLNNSSNANKIFTRACTACHQMVHGSNAPSGQTLLR